MSGNIPDNAFILGTQEGIAIPLSAARAKYYKSIGITADANVDIAMPEDVNLVTFYGTTDFLITNLDAELPAVAGWTSGAFYCVKGIFYDLIVPKNIRITGHGAGSVIMNCLVRWAAISNEGKYISS